MTQKNLAQNTAAKSLPESSDDDDEFGANDSRSEYSGAPIQEEIEVEVTADCIAVEEEPKRGTSSHLAIHS